VLPQQSFVASLTVLLRVIAEWKEPTRTRCNRAPPERLAHATTLSG
jgi:hypothetical protein